MNKKLTMIALSIVVGGTLLCTTAWASLSGSTGYDVYKSAFKKTSQSVSGTADIQVTDNGAAILKANDTAKVNLKNESMSTNLTITGGDKTATMDVYQQQDQTVVKNSDSDVYNVITHGEFEKHDHARIKDDPAHQAMAKDVENIVDLAMGNLKDYITLDENSDGTKTVSLKLAGSQITPLENAVAALFVKNGLREHESADSAMAAANDIIQANLPKLVSDIQVTNVDIKAAINGQNQIDNQSVNLTVSGKDSAGKTHEVVVSLNLKLSDFNNTNPDTIDLTGKQVKNITPQDFAGRHHE
ncbi:MAG: hypothetical protein ABFC94_06320 [Syntrophomonas sp.]